MKYIYIYIYISIFAPKEEDSTWTEGNEWVLKKGEKKRIQSLFIFIFISIQYNKKQLSFSFDAIFYRNRSDTIPFRLNKTDRQVLGKGLREEEEKEKEKEKNS